MPTAIDPIDPVLVFAELDRIKTGIAETAAAEEELEQSRRTRHRKLMREISDREQADAQAFQSHLDQLAEDLRKATEKENFAYEARKARVQHAYHQSRATLANRLQHQRDQRVGTIQNNILTERKKQQHRLDEALSSHIDLKTELAAHRQQRVEVQRSLLSALRSFKLLKRTFERNITPAGDLTLEQLVRQSNSEIKVAQLVVDHARELPLAKFFRRAPLSLLLLAFAASSYFIPIAITASLGALAIAGWIFAFTRSLPVARRASESISLSRNSALAAEKTSAATVAAIESEIADLEKNQTTGLSQTFAETEAELRARIQEGQKELQRQLATLPDRVQDLHRRRLEKINRANAEARTRMCAEAEKIEKNRHLARSTATTTTDAIIDSSIAKLAEPWNNEVIAPRDHLALLEKESRATFPAWTARTASTWSPPAEAPSAIRIGHLEIEPTGLPHNPRLHLPPPAVFHAPLALGFPNYGSLLIETDGDSTTANAALNAISTRILASLPPGRASFTFIDPVGLGKDFAGLMHLADYEETLIGQRIWTQTTQIEERLAGLNEHIEKVIQMYLRNEFATITDYNEQAGTIAEKYRFLVIAGYPNGFRETAAKRLRSIATSGARCGVHLLIQQDLRAPSIDSVLDEELRRNCLRVSLKNGVFTLAENTVVFDPAPADEDATVLIHRIGKASVDSNRVEVPFSQISPEALWQLDTSDELRVPIGRTGAKKLQMLAIGKGTRQHALVAGKTGSGKSTLFHVIITNLALHCSPQQVEFYLVDFKKGVEFKCYADKKLPHARVIAIESDRQFALSVLQRIDAELKHRGELFRKANAQDLAAYNRSGEKLPRTLLLIDEFQEFFTEDDSTAQQASLLLDRIVRQGRAFGIHAILGSQTLGGAYTLARATLGQMAVRIALQCNEADAHLIMDEENPAPRLLTRPGEGIYNDQSGMLAANSPFQIVWLPERERDALLDEVNELARSKNLTAAPIVYEGNAPADLRDNIELTGFLRTPPTARPAVSLAWLGAPNSIKGPTAATFKRQSGSNLLVVSQSSEQSANLLATSLISLAAQYPADQAKFIILDPQAADDSADSLLKSLAAKIPHQIQLGGPAEIPTLLTQLAETLESRSTSSGKGEPEIYLIIHDLQRFKALRPDDEFKFSYDDTPAGPSPSQTLANLLGEGGPSGIHVLATIDNWNNVSRWIPRKLLAEFEMRVLFQMSATDSSNLIDSPAATTLGLHRALFHNEHLGTLETFRPYAEPGASWLEESWIAIAE